MNVREELLKSVIKDYIEEYSFQHTKNGFILNSGKISNYFINLKPLLHNQCFLYTLSSIIKDFIEEIRIKHDIVINGIGGPGYGALPMATATLMRLIEIDNDCVNNIYSFSLRDKRKDHGVYSFLDGPFKKNDIIMILDDVVTTGNSILKTINTCLDYGLKPIALFSIVNRENLDLQSMSNSLSYSKNLFTLGDFIDNS